MWQLMEDGGLRPIVFLRFNPDTYTDANGIRHLSCFSHTQHGVPYVPKDKQADWESRLTMLISRMHRWHGFDGVPDKEVTIEKLFFDGDRDETDAKSITRMNEAASTLLPLSC